jgi:hypothetical protein
MWGEGKINMGQRMALERVADLMEPGLIQINLDMIKTMLEYDAQTKDKRDGGIDHE